MSGNEHLTAIREITERIESWGDDAYRMGEDEPAVVGMMQRLNQHAEAMASELEDVKKNRDEIFRAMTNCMDAREKAENELSMVKLKATYGDLPAAESEATE